MARAALIIAAIVDVAVAALLVGVSGFLFGSGPESMQAGQVAAAGYIALVAFCILAPILGFALQGFGRPVGGILVARLPPVAALLVATLPPMP